MVEVELTDPAVTGVRGAMDMYLVRW
jgi:hypothetical protein